MELGAVGNVAAANMQRPIDGAQVAQTHSNATAPQSEVQTANAVQQAAQTPEMNAVRQAVEEINKSMKMHEQGLFFRVDEETGKTVVSVVDQDTDEVIRQIPTEETLEIAKSLEHVIGKLIQQKA